MARAYPPVWQRPQFILEELLADAEPIAAAKRPNIIFILADDMGFSDLGCYGSEIDTPNLNRLAAGGLRFTRFHNNPLCCPSRASLLTGLYPQQAGMAMLVGVSYYHYPYPAYQGDLNNRCVTMAEALRLGGYQTAACGKWHLTPPNLESRHNWPLQRGFDKFFGTIWGDGSYFDPVTLCRDNERIRATGNFYYTDAIGDNAVQYIDDFSKKDAPFFLYTAFTAPHYPLHAPAETIEKYKDRYRLGWDQTRRQRHAKMVELGIVEKRWEMSPRDPRVPPWQLAPYKDWESHRMTVYAAMIDRLDQNIGKIVARLEQLGIEDNTLIFFMSDNGAEGIENELGTSYRDFSIPDETRDGRIVRVGNTPDVLPGAADTFQSYGVPWGNVSNTPLRLYKFHTHEGGISTPLIAHWPAGIKQRNALTHEVGHETDILPTCLELAGVKYPSTYRGQEIHPLVGQSLTPIFRGQRRERGPIYWECQGDSAIRDGRWKLVSEFPDNWELYDMEADRTEMSNLAAENVGRMREMIAMYKDWAKKVGIQPWPLPRMTLRPPGASRVSRKREDALTVAIQA